MADALSVCYFILYRFKVKEDSLDFSLIFAEFFSIDISSIYLELLDFLEYVCRLSYLGVYIGDTDP